MERRHRTLKFLMIAVAVIGVGMVAVLRPSRGWAVALPALLLTMLLTAILGAGVRRGPGRAYWIGFALFGWAYLVPVYLLHDEIIINDPFSTQCILKKPLVRLLDIVMILGDGAKKGERLAGIAGDLAQVDDPSRFLVAWSLVGLLFAGMGGTIGRYFFRT